MQNYSKIVTGFSFLDQKWGGVYSGGNYFIFGSRKSGKTILVLNIIEHLIQNNNNVLFITSDRIKNLEILASSIYFDFSEAIANGFLKIEKISSELNSLEKVKEIIPKVNPSFLFIDDILYDQLVNLKDNYLDFIEFLEEYNITSFLVASVPKNEILKSIARKIAANSTGIIQLQKQSNRNYSGLVTLKPNVAHFEGEFETTYKVEPVKGLITLADNESAILSMLSLGGKPEIISDIKGFEYSNIYSEDEFRFLIDSKIALSKSIGEKVKIIIYEKISDNISTIELFDKLKTKIKSGDKICFTDRNLYILPEKYEKDTIKKLFSELDDVGKKLVNEVDDLENHFNRKIQTLNSNFKLI